MTRTLGVLATASFLAAIALGGVLGVGLGVLGVGACLALSAVKED